MRFLMPRAALLSTAGVALLGGAAALVKFSPAGSMLADIALQARADAVELSAAAGLRLENLMVEGRNMTSRDDLVAALDAERGIPILSLDVAKARAAIEALPWVKAAHVERQLPATVRVVIEEREAYALWQRGNRYTLVDRDGHAIVDIPEADQSLPLIVGADAPKSAAQLFRALGAHADLARRVRAAVRVGGRRWNIYFDTYEDGIAVRLPEDGLERSLERLAALEREHKILERDLDFIDLRLEDRLVLRVHGASENEKASPAATTKVPAARLPKNI